MEHKVISNALKDVLHIYMNGKLLETIDTFTEISKIKFSQLNFICNTLKLHFKHLDM